MSTRAIDLAGDWTFGQGRQNYLTGPAEIAQDVATALKVFRGECFFDTTFGVDWWNLLGGRSAEAIVLQCREVIAKRPSVTAILGVDPSFDSLERNLLVAYRIATVFTLQTSGSVVVSGA